MLKNVLRFWFTGIALALISMSAHAELVKNLFHQSGDPVAGNPKGKVTVVEFFDYRCGHCVEMDPIIRHIMGNNAQVRVVYKELPIRGKSSELAARAALAAHQQGKYQALHHTLMTTSQPITEQYIMEAATSHGIDTAQLKKDMYSETINKQLRHNESLANQLGIDGTPAFLIGATNAQNMQEVKFVLGGLSRSELQNEIHRHSAS